MRSVILTALACTLLLSSPSHASPRSVILIVGDGFDDTHVTMGRNYLAGQSGSLLLDELPVRGAVQVETIDSEGNPLYVADSANTATSLDGS